MIVVQEITSRNPISMAGYEAGVCYGADVTDAQKNYKRGLDCLESGHGRVLEFPQIYLEISGYSARVIRELYTHISGAPTRLQASTRYIDYTNEGFDCIIPKSIEKNADALQEWSNIMDGLQYDLGWMMEKYNIPKEDIANGLPLGMTTKIVFRTNLRQLIDMSHQRLCSRAYWEFRKLMLEIMEALSEYSDEWKEVIELSFKPKCDICGYCNEKRGCGKRPSKNEFNKALQTLGYKPI